VSTKKPLDELNAEIDKLRKEIRTDQLKMRKLEKEHDFERTKTKFVALINADDGVRISPHCNRSDLRGKRGNIKKVNRTRAEVIVEGREWYMAFNLLFWDEYSCELTVDFNRWGQR
jgi:hypothetical protein